MDPDPEQQTFFYSRVDPMHCSAVLSVLFAPSNQPTQEMEEIVGGHAELKLKILKVFFRTKIYIFHLPMFFF